MDERSMGLIQRAAARLAGQGIPNDLMPPPIADLAKPFAAPVDDAAHSQRLSRQVVIDRGRLASSGIAIPSSERSKSVEEFRIIKQGLLRNAASDPERGRLIMVTSARPREGKTFTSLNLALSIASERDMRVLLIDCDVHRQTLVEMLGIEADKGLFDLLTDPELDIADVLLRTNIANFTVLPSGKAGPLVPELLSSNKMSDLMDEMHRRYPDRFIILDAPPCLATSDPSVLAGLVGQVVFVVEANRTQEPEIAAALRLISSCPNIGLVLNKTLGVNSDQFGSYSYY
jgi:receptor protein-tyrosine kinase